MTSNPAYTEHTGGLEVAKAYSSQASGKYVLITGVSLESLGYSIACSFAHGGASTIIITGRNKDRLEQASQALATKFPTTRFRELILELDSLQAVRTSALEILNDDSIPRIDILVACAGTHDFNPKRTLTTDGIESHLAINHLSHFHLTVLLLPKIRAAAKISSPGSTRIITLTSESITCSPFRFSDYNFDGNALPEDERPNFEPLKGIQGVQETHGYESNIAYAQSKTANVLFTVHLNTLLSSEGVYAFVLHPGLVTSKSAAPVLNSMTEDQKTAIAAYGIIKNLDQGAATTVVAALDPGLVPSAGVYLRDCQIASAPEWATSEEKAKRLWELSEKLVSSASK